MSHDGILGTFHRWSQTGIECLKSNADCENCDVFKTFKIRQGDGCKQAEANASLLSRGIQPRVVETEVEKPKIIYGLGAMAVIHRERAGTALKNRIVAFLRTSPEFTATMREIVEALNREKFLDVPWNVHSIRNHVIRLIEAKAVATSNSATAKCRMTLLNIEKKSFNHKFYAQENHSWRRKGSAS